MARVTPEGSEMGEVSVAVTDRECVGVAHVVEEPDA